MNTDPYFTSAFCSYRIHNYKNEEIKWLPTAAKIKTKFLKLVKEILILAVLELLNPDF